MIVTILVLVNSTTPGLIQLRYNVEPRHNNPRYNDIPSITVDKAMIDITIFLISSRPNVKTFPNITMLSVHSHNLNKTMNLIQ